MEHKKNKQSLRLYLNFKFYISYISFLIGRDFTVESVTLSFAWLLFGINVSFYACTSVIILLNLCNQAVSFRNQVSWTFRRLKSLYRVTSHSLSTTEHIDEIIIESKYKAFLLFSNLVIKMKNQTWECDYTRIFSHSLHTTHFVSVLIY